jgi:hypothetical protein
MPKYKVREGENIVHDNEQYGPGDVLTCTEKQAALLRVDPVEDDSGPTAKELVEQIKTMTDIEELGKLFQGETRTTVKDSLKARIKELKATEKK